MARIVVIPMGVKLLSALYNFQPKLLPPPPFRIPRNPNTGLLNPAGAGCPQSIKVQILSYVCRLHSAFIIQVSYDRQRTGTLSSKQQKSVVTNLKPSPVLAVYLYSTCCIISPITTSIKLVLREINLRLRLPCLQRQNQRRLDLKDLGGGKT